MSARLIGNYYVKPTFAAIRDAFALFPRFGDYQEARRHALKLAFWPGGSRGQSGKVMDLDWEWIKGLGNLRVGELRISDVIGGHNNLRIIFYVSDVVLAGDPLPRIWTLAVLQKKSNKFTSRDLQVFRARLIVLRKRTYNK